MMTAIKARFGTGVLVLCLSVLLAGCVSQRSGGGAQEVNVQKALEAYVKLAIGYIENRNRESARHHLRKAFELDKNSAQATAAQALLYQVEGEAELAEENFKRALRLDPDFSQARNNYASFLYAHERYAEAFEQFTRVSRDLDYNNRDLSLLNLGRTALKMGNKERAKAAFEHAYNLNPRMPTLLLELAQISFEDEDYAQAKRYLDRYGELARQSAQSLLLNIKIERIFGNKDKEASHAMALKNRFPYSREYLEYKREMSN